jgi:hypothetical protein
LAVIEEDAPHTRERTFVRVLCSGVERYGYTRAELILAMQEVPFDREASHNYGRGLNPADVHRVIERRRRLHAALTRPVSSERRDEVIMAFPSEVDPDAWHKCGFDDRNRPLWRYAPHAGTYTPPDAAQHIAPR